MVKISDDFNQVPERLAPYIVMVELNEPISVAKGPFRLIGSTEGDLDADLVFGWLPSSAIRFDGLYSHAM